MAGIGRAEPSPRHATHNPLRLMFSVYIAVRIQSAGEVTWHRSLISIRGLSRLFMFRISLKLTLPNLAPNPNRSNIVIGLYPRVAQG